MKKKEIIRFLISGCSAVATDFAFYYFLKDYFSLSLSKAISFVCGTAVAYVLNKYWTFQIKERSINEVVCFVVLYSVSLGLNVSVNKIALFIFSDWYFFAFLCSTGASTILNFIGQKWWVFKEVKISE